MIPRRDFELTRYGAIGDGRTDSLPALRSAMAACRAAGGGRVVVPPGRYFLGGPIHLQSRVELHLEAGAVLQFSGRPSDYLPIVLVRWEGTRIYNYSPLIYARGAEDIAITGEGMIDGNARAGFLAWVGPRQEAGRQRARRMGAEGAPLEERKFGPGYYLRPGMIEPYQCRRVLIQGVTLRDSPFWVVHPVFCSEVTVREVKVESRAINNDGCDPDSCRDVLIEDCSFHCGDDGIAIKAGRDADAWKAGEATENVLIRRCDFRSPNNSICIGSEMSGGVRNVEIEDCTVEEGGSALYFKSNRDRGGEIAQVRARRIRIRHASVAAIRIETHYPGYRGGNAPTAFRDFDLEDVTCDRSDLYGILIDGNRDKPVENVRLRRISIEGARTPFFFRQVEGLDCEEVRIDGRLLPEHPPPAPADALRPEIKN